MEVERPPVADDVVVVVTSCTSTATAAKLEVSIDDAFEQHVGSQMGVSQMFHMLLIFMAWIFDAQITLVTIFTDAQPEPAAAVKSVCGPPQQPAGTWEWIDGNKGSVIAEFGLICNRKFIAALPSSFFFLGSLLGSAAFGRLADGWVGRKRCLFISCICTSVSAYLTSLSPNIWVYAFLRLSTGFLKSGFNCCLVLASESVAQKWRGQVGQYGFLLFTAGCFSLPAIAYPTRKNWRYLYKIISVPPLLYSPILLLFVSESPRWLLVRGRSEEALDVLRRFARRNGRKLPDHLCLNCSVAAAQDESLWRTKWAVKRMILIMLSGFGVGFVYYRIQLNVENLNFNLYFSVALNALMEVPAVFIGSIMLALMKRRHVFSMLSGLAGVLCLLCMIFSHHRGGIGDEHKPGRNWAQLLTEGAGFMALCIAFDVMYIYCVELFPTSVRNFAMSMLRQAIMLGASVSPLLVVIGRVSSALSFLVFGVLSVLSATTTFCLPETQNSPLYDTLKQQQEGEEEKLNATKLAS